MTIYDKAEWHYNGNFPHDLPAAQGYVHGGMFLGWLADRELLSGKAAAAAAAFRQREQTGAQLYKRLGGVLSSALMTPEGAAFAQDYYSKDSGINDYLADYFDLFMSVLDDMPSVYHVPDTWEHYQLVADMLNQRYAAWQAAAD